MSKNKQEKLANMKNSPQVRGKNINDTHNIVKEAKGPNVNQ